ncbi:potassium-transporting ATPase subunit KdpC [Domibacillus aminovorans]|uniref:Potassium-transporting ATPase KdpC subunit n=1 Tax=Domibacillus aminovorans TaxID=29332 RepID=A0A177L3P5_9BACI|nr:potassium-transporting ATPase subunit KdpC [Domibacillus aminovorans]OAH60298.1 potassium-transporting ATPase subunit C [Domibacillus aminovorans]
MLKNLRLSLVLLLICGVAYPLAMTGISQVIMPAKADGSMIKDEDGNDVGSELIGQMFTDPSYFSGRVSSIEYNGAGSGSGNYAPSNEDMIERTKEDMEAFLKNNPDVNKEDIPADLLTNSGSGLDPHISPMAAEIQVPRVASERGLSEEELEKLIEKHTEGRQFGVFGEPRVNVLKLNMALDQF